MTRNETPPDQKGGSGQWLKSNLSALGSATVFAVYAAGFIRTKAAAASLADEPVRRVQTAVLAPTTAAPTAAAPTTAAPTTQPASVAHEAAPQSPKPNAAAPATAETKAPAAKSPAPSNAAPAPATTVASSQPSAPALPAAKVPAAGIAANVAPPTLSAPVAASLKPVPATPTQAPAPVEKQAPAATPAPAAPATDAAAATAPAHAGFKDGTYVGYGRSNHGDIEATVDIVDGQIVDAYITKCLTEYSCSWIVALPPQVSQRQSAEVDIVSGATASSNAFYAAIRQALSKAK